MKKVTSNNFKQTMTKFATGITVISINNNKNFLGKTVNSFASLSLKPPLVLFSLDKKSSALSKFKRSKYIGINFLSKKQKNLSDYFSKNKNHWGSTNYFFSKKNIPMIRNSLANLCCKRLEMVSKGDHIIFICEVLELKFNNNLKPLIYINKKFL